mmetsp:Transcript_4658/g.14085  ORF Transcript_4658/g.14085 Transcript_4658/m.14085 type:complete len:436 (+) Transcript_4658:103-1410(+)
MSSGARQQIDGNGSNYVVQYLKKREVGQRTSVTALTAKIPRRYVPITRIIDRDRKILSCVILGFSADAEHLVSYERKYTRGGSQSAEEDAYSFYLTLQYWRFNGPVEPLTIVYETELFGAFRFDTEDLRLFSGAIGYVENEQSGLCFVHYKALGGSSYIEHHMSVLPSPTSVKGDSNVINLRYQVYDPVPGALPNFTVITGDENVTLLLNTGASLRVVTFTNAEKHSKSHGSTSQTNQSTFCNTKGFESGSSNPLPWWTTQEICTSQGLPSAEAHCVKNPMPIRQMCFDFEEYIMHVFSVSSVQGQIENYHTEILRFIGRNSVLVHFLVTGIGSGRLHSVISCINITSGEARVISGIHSMEASDDIKTRISSGNTLRELIPDIRSIERKYSARLDAGAEDNWKLSDLNVCQLGRPLSRLQHPLSIYVITGYHGDR